MVLFTLGSLLIGGTSRSLAWHLPQVFACYLPLINYIPLSFTDITLWQSMPFSYRKWTHGGKIWLSCGRTSVFALCCTGSNSPATLRWNCPLWMALRFGGGTKTPPQHRFLVGMGRGGHRGQTFMVYQLYGWTLVKSGFLLWRKWVGNWLPAPPVELIGLMP